MNRRAEHDISRKLKVLNHAKEIGNISKTCRYFGICRETFYTWKRSYEAQGEQGLIDSRPCPENHKLRTPKPIEEKIKQSQSPLFSQLLYSERGSYTL